MLLLLLLLLPALPCAWRTGRQAPDVLHTACASPHNSPPRWPAHAHLDCVLMLMDPCLPSAACACPVPLQARRSATHRSVATASTASLSEEAVDAVCIIQVAASTRQNKGSASATSKGFQRSVLGVAGTVLRCVAARCAMW
jgi:hypothetical protein